MKLSSGYNARNVKEKKKLGKTSKKIKRKKNLKKSSIEREKQSVPCYVIDKLKSKVVNGIGAKKHTVTICIYNK